MRSGARAEEAADCKMRDVRLRIKREATLISGNSSEAKEYKNFFNTDFMDIEKSFLESKVKKVARVTTKQGSSTTTGDLINESVPSTTKRHRGTGSEIESDVVALDQG